MKIKILRIFMKKHANSLKVNRRLIEIFLLVVCFMENWEMYLLSRHLDLNDVR